MATPDPLPSLPSSRSLRKILSRQKDVGCRQLSIRPGALGRHSPPCRMPPRGGLHACRRTLLTLRPALLDRRRRRAALLVPLQRDRAWLAPDGRGAADDACIVGAAVVRRARRALARPGGRRCAAPRRNHDWAGSLVVGPCGAHETLGRRGGARRPIRDRLGLVLLLQLLPPALEVQPIAGEAAEEATYERENGHRSDLEAGANRLGALSGSMPLLMIMGRCVGGVWMRRW